MCKEVGFEEGHAHLAQPRLRWALAFVLTCACGGPTSPGNDASTNDGGSSGSTDAGPAVDFDDDGVAALTDCDDNDPAIGTAWVRSCATACSPGAAEICTNGVWAPCDAPADCNCPSDGETRLVECGQCGMQSQQCQSGTWTPTSACLAEGVCGPGQSESRVYRCAMQQRLCTDACQWTDWLNVDREPGQCLPGERDCRTAGMYRVCTADCAWMRVATFDECWSSP